MSIDAVTPLRRRMIEDMNARKLCAQTQRGHIHSCKRFAEFLKRSPETATVEDIRRFQLHLSEAGVSICNRNRIMTGLRFLFRVTLRRLDLAAEIYHIREPQKIPLVMSPDETRRLLAVANILKVRILLSLAYGCGLRAGEVVRLKVKHIDGAQRIIRIEQSKGRKDRHVMLSPETVDLLRQWWKVRRGFDDTTPPLYLKVTSGSIPLFLIASEARAEARNSISRLEPSISPEPATTAAENTWTNWISGAMLPAKSTPAACTISLTGMTARSASPAATMPVAPAPRGVAFMLILSAMPSRGN